MKRQDLVLFYHPGDVKEVVGIAKVAKEAYPDPTAEEGDWSAVDLAPVKPLKRRISLQTIKGDKALKDMPLLKQSRLSVVPVTSPQFERLLALGETRVWRDLG
jgi:predicted RNA-binding protein with PUA-like domain